MTIIVCFTCTSLTVQCNYTSSITSLTILLPLPPTTTITGNLPPPNMGYKLDFEICHHQTWATVHQDLNKTCLLPTIQHLFTNHQRMAASKFIIKLNNKFVAVQPKAVTGQVIFFFLPTRKNCICSTHVCINKQRKSQLIMQLFCTQSLATCRRVKKISITIFIAIGRGSSLERNMAQSTLIHFT